MVYPNHWSCRTVDDRELELLEERTRHAVAGSLKAALVALQREVTSVYLAVAGDTRHALVPFAQDTIRRRLVDALSGLIGYDYVDTRAVLRMAARTAIEGGSADLDIDVSPHLPDDILTAMTTLTANMKADLRDALKLAKHGPLQRYGEMQAVLGTARKALNHADATAVWIVHRAHNEGRRRAIDKAAEDGTQISMMWRAERDACVACLAYAGGFAAPAGHFRPLLRVADASAPSGPVAGPPLHPHCRCQLEWWFGPIRDLDDTDLPVALRREAQRSIATGQAQGSEPGRIRAADRLLDVADLLIPKTVRRRARKAITAGTFQL